MALHKILLPDGVTELANIKSVTFKEAVNSGVDLRPGCVGSASIEVEVYGAQTNAVSVGDALTYYQIDKGGNQTLIGVFYAEPVIATKNSWKFVAYDAAQKLNADFSSWLQANQASFPMTIYALVSAACTEAGVTLGSASWTLSTESVQAFYADGITCRQILSYAAELGCKFVRCHSDGKVYFDWYATVANKRIYPSAGTSGSETRYAYKQDGLSYSNFTTAGIDGVAVHPSGEDDVAYIYPTTPTGDNLLNITNNLLLTGADAALYNAAAQAIYNAINTLGTYRPTTARLFPRENPFRAGDLVAVTDAQGVSFTTVVMEQTVTDSDATLTSTGNENYAEGESNPKKALVQLASDVVRINKLKVSYADIDQAIITYLTTNNVTAQNMTIVDAADNVLATFNANGITIGETDQSHMVVDSNSFELYDKNGNVYVSIGDLRNQSGFATITQEMLIERGERVVSVNFAISSVDSLLINNVATTEYVVGVPNQSSITLNNALTEDSIVSVQYKTASTIFHFDMGTRKAGTLIGAWSVVNGRNQTASGVFSAVGGGNANNATGYGSTVGGGDHLSAIGDWSSVLGGYGNVAEGEDSTVGGGYGNTAHGEYSAIGGGGLNTAQSSGSVVGGGYSNKALGQLSTVAGGRDNEAKAYSSFAVGEGVIAGGRHQFACGKYCVEDTNDSYAEVVGNGADDNNRSNARTLDWSGNEVLAGGLTINGELESTSYFTRKLPSSLSAGTTYLGTRFEDDGGNGRGGIGFYPITAYGEGIRLYTTRGGTSHGVAMFLDANNNPSVVFAYPGAWRNGLGITADYAAGDTISFPSSGNSYFTRFHGDWRDTKNLYFLIPTSRSCVGLSATVSGTIYLVTNGVRNSVSMSNVTPTCFCTDSGIAVRLTWATAPSYAVQYNLASVQPYGFTVTFS